jgi:predicted glycosyltransferase
VRVLLYSPDSYGLGHVRRSLSISEKLLSQHPGCSVLLLTGAPRAHYFSYPPRCDYVKLPSVTKDAGGEYVSREIGISIEEAVRLREGIVQSATRLFAPDVFCVDHSPLGLCGEAVPTLEYLEGRDTLRVLGMRDVIDAPEQVRDAWRRDGVVDALRRLYDVIIVYGQRDVFDPITEYGIPPDVAAKMTFAGYIGRNGALSPPDELLRRYAPRTGRLVVVTVGGGGDGDGVVKMFLRGCERLGANRPFESVVITGPLMGHRKRSRFGSWGARLEGTTILEFTSDLPGLIRASSLVVSMGGYNTVCDLACAGARALIVPRTFPRKEQIMRAQRLADRGVAQCLSIEGATPDRLLSEVLLGLERPRPPRGWGLDFSGLKTTVAVLTGARRDAPPRVRRASDRGALP